MSSHGTLKLPHGSCETPVRNSREAALSEIWKTPVRRTAKDKPDRRTRTATSTLPHGTRMTTSDRCDDVVMVMLPQFPIIVGT